MRICRPVAQTDLPVLIYQGHFGGLDGVRAAERVGGRSTASLKGRPGPTQEDGVSEFDDLEKKAQDFVEEHPEQADKKIDEVANIPEHDTDYQLDEHIDQAMDDAEQQQTSQGHDQPGS